MHEIQAKKSAMETSESTVNVFGFWALTFCFTWGWEVIKKERTRFCDLGLFGINMLLVSILSLYLLCFITWHSDVQKPGAEIYCAQCENSEERTKETLHINLSSIMHAQNRERLSAVSAISLHLKNFFNIVEAVRRAVDFGSDIAGSRLVESHEKPRKNEIKLVYGRNTQHEHKQERDKTQQPNPAPSNTNADEKSHDTEYTFRWTQH